MAKLERELAELKMTGDTTVADRRALESARRAFDDLKDPGVDDTLARLVRERDKLIADIESEDSLASKLTTKRKSKKREKFRKEKQRRKQS